MPPAACPRSAPPKAAASPFYDRAIAAKIFEASGRAERFAAGATLFTEDQKAASGGLFSRGAAARMYYLAQGAGRPQRRRPRCSTRSRPAR